MPRFTAWTKAALLLGTLYTSGVTADGIYRGPDAWRFDGNDDTTDYAVLNDEKRQMRFTDLGPDAAFKAVPKEKRDARYQPPVDWNYDISQSGPKDGTINVHMVPHTHDDTGWLITVDQYYYQNVQYILDTVVAHLDGHPKRTFIYVETAFFVRWWMEQRQDTKDAMRRLIANGQFVFINGGWCMHDEAAPHYNLMVDQTTRGHQFLRREFGVIPQVTWQIDPFGHSHTQSYLMSAEAGMDALYFGRLDFQDFNARVAHPDTQGLEWVWEGSRSLGSIAHTFTGQLYGPDGRGGYGAPSFCDFNNDGHEIQDDARMHDYNVDSFCATAVKFATKQASEIPQGEDNIMWTMGSDFNYQNAQRWYKNMDKLIFYCNKAPVNMHGRKVNFFYSDPVKYTEAKRASDRVWEVRKDDLFPLADDYHHYWTGYFTSRPALKYYERTGLAYLNFARQIEALVNQTGFTDKLEAGVAVTAHHDGMSGTEKQAVTDDYETRVGEGFDKARSFVVQKGLGWLVSGARNDEEGGGGTRSSTSSSTPSVFHQCEQLNISLCEYTTRANGTISTVVWNQLGQPHSGPVFIPIRSPNASCVLEGAELPVDVVPVSALDARLWRLYMTGGDGDGDGAGAGAYPERWQRQRYTNNATHVVVALVTAPPVGFVTLQCTPGRPSPSPSPSPSRRASMSREAPTPAVASSIENDHFVIHTAAAAEPSKGMFLQSITNKKGRVTSALDIKFGYYRSSEGGCTAGVNDRIACSNQKGGAYIFRPNSTEFVELAPLSVRVHHHHTYQEVEAEMQGGWVHVAVRLYRGDSYPEVLYTVGPVPLKGDPVHPAEHKHEVGKEVVMRILTDIDNGNTFFTDSNAREMVERRVNERPASYPKLIVSEPIAGNYFPVNTLLQISAVDRSRALAIAVDRSMGGGAIANGEMELMVHRRLVADDSRGVSEFLNETMCGCRNCHCHGLTIRGRQRLLFGSMQEVNTQRRTVAESLTYPLVPSFATEAAVSGTMATVARSRSFLTKALPPNVKLLTFKRMPAQDVGYTKGTILLRLAHLYGVGETGDVLSEAVTVKLGDHFGGEGGRKLQARSCREWTLTVNAEITPSTEQQRRGLEWKTMGGTPRTRRAFDVASQTLTLLPMEVRTFVCVG